MQHLDGIRVVVSPDRPRQQLSERVTKPFVVGGVSCTVLSPRVIEETNAWLLRFFGTWNVVHDGQVLHDTVNNCFHMNPRTYERLRKAALPSLSVNPGGSYAR